ncbi:MAG TPA: PRC-barrel domain-containing protein [Dongiaceae bacterium]|nr:PRC-barrel domain-containing protein [Dongiaceae bacterium]
MKRALLLSGAVTAMLGAAPFAMADDTIVTETDSVQIAQAAEGEVDAGKLIGQDVYDANGDKVGNIDSVMVDPNGEVNSVVIDVSGWLESEKLVSVEWSDLKTREDDKIVSSLTKDSAEAATAYEYMDQNLRGQVLTESGEAYVAADADAPADTTADETTTADTDADATEDADGTATATADADADADATDDSAVINADGSLNASKLIGLDVQSPEDKKVGDIGEVVLDKEGQVEGVVVDVGGFLGIATHPVLLDWKDMTLASQDGKDRAVVNLTKEKLEQMPAYEVSKQ